MYFSNCNFLNKLLVAVQPSLLLNTYMYSSTCIVQFHKFISISYLTIYSTNKKYKTTLKYSTASFEIFNRIDAVSEITTHFYTYRIYPFKD